MCKPESKCEKPWNLKGKPGECSPSQIRKCHRESKAQNHPDRKKSR
jgi:hypothetical protein